MTRDPPALDKGRLVAAVERLPATQRDIYLLCARDGLSLAAAAEHLGLEPAAVERLLADAIYALDRTLRRAALPWWRRFR